MSREVVRRLRSNSRKLMFITRVGGNFWRPWILAKNRMIANLFNAKSSIDDWLRSVRPGGSR
jgi:hypothetical protein